MPHIHERIDFTAEAFIVHDGRVLLRRHDKYKLWLSVGGHVELDEDPNETAIREAKEEVGLDITLVGTVIRAESDERVDDGYTELLPPRFMNRHRITATHEHVTLTYVATSATDTLTLSRTERSDACRWFTAHELRDPVWGVTPRVRRYALAALEIARREA